MRSEYYVSFSKIFVRLARDIGTVEQYTYHTVRYQEGVQYFRPHISYTTQKKCVNAKAKEVNKTSPLDFNCRRRQTKELPRKLRQSQHCDSVPIYWSTNTLQQEGRAFSSIS